jgi:16S rRNA C967 or C1407 C5-methylase (RsmB/RsmF family)
MNADTCCPETFNQEYPKKLAEKYGYRDWMISRFLNFVPNTELLLEYIEKNESSYFAYIRANSLKINSMDLKNRLLEKGYCIKDTILKDVFKIDISGNSNNPNGRNTISLSSIGSTLEYLKGYYYIQDLSSCIAVDELDLDEGD